VREFVIHNALYWIEEFNLDGLRLDAVHAIIDDGTPHLLDELAERVREFAGPRPVHLVLENEENEASRLVCDAHGRPRWFTAQWNDDVHHVLHTAATGEASGYYADYHGDTAKLGRALAEGFVFQGELMHYRGSARGEPSTALPPTAFVAFVQNHDQVGNRAFGERLGRLAPPEAVRAVAAVYLLSPQIPMLFMGEEWDAEEPFLFFCDLAGEAADAVREGRRQEFARFPEFKDPATRARIPDPVSPDTFAASRLRWEEAATAPHADRLDWYRRVLQVCHATIVPLLRRIGGHAGRSRVIGPGALVARWTIGTEGVLLLAANLSARAASGFPALRGRVLLHEGERGSPGHLGPWTVQWSLADPHAADE
jgi:malto-oligosyltrehalose trehalohydrolase